MKPKIAYLTSNDPRDRRSWSGTHFFMAQALQKNVGDVTMLGPLVPPLAPVAKAFDRGLRLTIGKRYMYTHSKWLSKRVARMAEEKLKADNFDFIFAPAGATEIAYLETDLPIVYLSDTTISLICGYYPEFSNVFSFCLREAEILEQKAIDKSAIAIYPSQWAADSAIKDYHASKEKVRIIPFGANLDDPPSRELLETRTSSNRCRLLFVGMEWDRKGGQIAFDTLLELQKMGVPADLTMVGCTPPKSISHKNLKVMGFLNKNKPDEREKLARLFLDSDFMVLPTQMECTAIAFCEASANGLPVIATNTGGVSGAIEDGDNGFLMPPTATGRDYAETVARLFADQNSYGDLRRRSRRAFEERLNWDAWAKAVGELVATRVYEKV